jgi:carboxymethylenebutenolidase
MSSFVIRDGMKGYLAAPRSGNGPGIVVLQEIFGVNSVMRGIADDLAAQGYFALVPDLFWRLEPGIELTDKSDSEWQQAFDLMNRFDVNTGVEDIQVSIDTLRAHPGVGAKVGAVGYCLGGLLAYLTATRTNAEACVSYYGVNIQTLLAEGAAIRKPLLLHIAGQDQFVPRPAQDQVIAALKDNPHVEIYRYEGVNHAFARDGGKHYDQPAAVLANSRTAEFFRRHLG